MTADGMMGDPNETQLQCLQKERQRLKSLLFPSRQKKPGICSVLFPYRLYKTALLYDYTVLVITSQLLSFQIKRC